MNKIVLITGPAGSGKSTVAQYLEEVRGYALKKMAGPLKGMLYAAGFTHAQLEGSEKETPMEWLNGVTPRYLMQTLGTEWGRLCVDENIWVKLAIKQTEARLCESYDTPYAIVFDDVRFPNEIRLMKKAFSNQVLVLEIIPRFKEYSPIEESGHASEQQILPADKLIYNTGSIEDLLNQIDEILK